MSWTVWITLPLLLAVAGCASVPSPPARPRPIPDQRTPEADGTVRLAREEWFLKRRQEADGTVPVDAFGLAQASRERQPDPVTGPVGAG